MMPLVFVGHGSPMLALEDSEGTRDLKRMGEYILENYPRPKAILMISAHWFTKGSKTQSVENPEQIYDMYGFPRELYEFKYPVKGCKDLTDRLRELSDKISIDDSWGIDHGTWTVLCHIFPDASIPVVQLSVDYSLTDEEAFEFGSILSKLSEEGYLVMGSGNIVHNLRKLDWHKDSGSEEAVVFDNYIKEAILNKDYKKVLAYKELEESKLAVPTRDHFMPLLYILGAARDREVEVFNNYLTLSTISMTSYLFK